MRPETNPKSGRTAAFSLLQPRGPASPAFPGHHLAPGIWILKSTLQIEDTEFQQACPSCASKRQVAFTQSSGFRPLLPVFWKLPKGGKPVSRLVPGSAAPQAVIPLLPTPAHAVPNSMPNSRIRQSRYALIHKLLAGPRLHHESRCGRLPAGSQDPSQTLLTNQQWGGPAFHHSPGIRARAAHLDPALVL